MLAFLGALGAFMLQIVLTGFFLAIGFHLGKSLVDRIRVFFLVREELKERKLKAVA